MELAFLVTVFVLLAAMGLRELNRNTVISRERAARELAELDLRKANEHRDQLRQAMAPGPTTAMLHECQSHLRAAVVAHGVMRDALGCPAK